MQDVTATPINRDEGATNMANNSEIVDSEPIEDVQAASASERVKAQLTHNANGDMATAKEAAKGGTSGPGVKKGKKRQIDEVEEGDLDGDDGDDESDAEENEENAKKVSSVDLEKLESTCWCGVVECTYNSPKTEQGNELIDDYINVIKRGGQAKLRIPDTICRAIKDHQSFLPRAATTSRELALACLKTNRRNTFCVFHHTHDKKGQIYDGSTKAKHLVTGVPVGRIAKKKRHDKEEAREGFLSCGCTIDAALFDFYLWKTWTATNDKGETEGLGSQCFDPRTRWFLVKNAYGDDAALTVDDFYSNDTSTREATKK
jgi:hypothetical protein